MGGEEEENDQIYLVEEGESGVEWEVVGGGGMDKGQPRLVVAHFVSILVAHYRNAPLLSA